MSFFQRIANYLANEVVTKTLANSRVFREAAQRTHHHVQKTKGNIEKGKLNAAEDIGKAKEEASSFLSDVAKELRKEIGVKK